MRRALRWSAWGLGGLLLVAVVMYVLRWPIFGGRIRGELVRIAGESLNSDIAVDHLGGSLLFGLDGEGFVLHPRPGSPLKSGSLRKATIEYGFLGMGPLRITATGVEIALAPRPGPAPPIQESIRDAVPLLRGLRFEGRAEVHEIHLVLGDGRRVEGGRAMIEGDRLTAEFRTEGFGTVGLKSAQSREGEVAMEAEATEGPVRSVKVNLGPPSATGEPLRIQGRYQDESVSWEGSLGNDPQGRPVLARGRLVLPEGHAETEVDLLRGRALLDVAGTFPVRETLQAGVELRGRAEGPLEGPLGEWTFSDVVARSRNAHVDTLAIDSIEVSCAQGSLSSLPIAARVIAGPDQATVTGLVRWTGSLEIELKGRAQAEVLSPYLHLLKNPPPLELAGVRAEGTFRWSEGSASFDGMVEGGPGSWEGRAWESLRIDGAVSKTGILARELLLTGTDIGPILRGKGSLQGDRLQAELEAGPDRATLQARLPSSGEAEGEFSIDGPCLWLNALGVSLPAWASPLHLRGKGSRRGEEAAASLTLTGGAGWSWASDVAIRHRGEDWSVTVAAGAVSLPESRTIRHDSFSVVGKAGHVLLPDLRVTSDNPPVSTRLSTQVDWDDRGARVKLQAGELEVQKIHLDGLLVTVDLAPGGGSATVDARWGREGGPEVRISGRLGRENDLHVFLRAPDLLDPSIRTLVGGPPLVGSVTAGLRLQGSMEQPEISGTLSLQGLAMGEWKPVNLLVAVTTEERRRVRVWSEEATPYGAFKLDGRMDLPGSESKPRLDFSASLRVEDLTPFLQKIDPGALPWIPPGTVTVEAHLKGPLGSPSGWVEGSFQSKGYRPPAPLGPVSDLRLTARLDESGLQIASLEGRLGGGAFQGKGLWELWKPERPMAIHVTGDELLVLDDVLARIRIKPDATLRYSTARGLVLTGMVEVPLALYHRELGGSDLGTPERRGVVPLEARAPRLRLIPLAEGGFRIPGIPGLEDLSLDLEFKTTGEFLIENSLIGIQLNAEGRIRGTGAVPALSGTVTSKPRRGEIRIGPGAFIRIESAQLILPEAAGKEGSIRFEGRIGSGQDQITILVSGPPEHATLTLISDPPKDQRELLATLAQSAALGTLTAQVIGGGGFEDWPSATRKEGFLSRIAPTVIPGESGVHQRTPWELPAAGTNKGTLVRTEYLYNQYFSVLAETNHAATLAGDLKFRIRF